MFSAIGRRIDALITLGIGVCAFGYGTWLAQARNQKSPKWTRILRGGGVALAILGVIQLLAGQSIEPVWQRVKTSDGVASAEFPGQPEADEQKATMGELSVTNTTLTYNVPDKDLSLILSFSAIPPDQRNIPDAERIAALKVLFEQQGFSLVRQRETPLGAARGFAVDLQRNEGKTRLLTRIAFVDGKAYRVLAASTGAFSDDPLVARFLDSFRIERGSNGVLQ